jgi:uncharacterized protein
MTEPTSAAGIPAVVIDTVATVMPEAVQKPTGTKGQVESLVTSWTGPDGSMAGVWECSPGTFTTQKKGVFETSQVISGRATVTSDEGTVQEISAGSMVVLPDGWSGTWQVHETIRKSATLVPTTNH